MNTNKYVMPVKAIKNILRKELQGHKDSFYQVYPKFIMSDFQKEMVSVAHEVLKGRLESCDSYESLDDYIGPLYRMSLQEWIESL